MNSIGDVNSGIVNFAMLCSLLFAMEGNAKYWLVLVKTKRYCFSIHDHRFAKVSLVLGNQWVPVKNPSY